VVTESVTEKRTVTPAAGFPKASLTVAVTQCCSPALFVAAAGDSVTVAGAPDVTGRKKNSFHSIWELVGGAA